MSGPDGHSAAMEGAQCRWAARRSESSMHGAPFGRTTKAVLGGGGAAAAFSRPNAMAGRQKESRTTGKTRGRAEDRRSLAARRAIRPTRRPSFCTRLASSLHTFHAHTRTHCQLFDGYGALARSALSSAGCALCAKPARRCVSRQRDSATAPSTCSPFTAGTRTSADTSSRRTSPSQHRRHLRLRHCHHRRRRRRRHRRHHRHRRHRRRRHPRHSPQRPQSSRLLTRVLLRASTPSTTVP